MALQLQEIAATIREIEDARSRTFVPTRYPYTYAYDYLAYHDREFAIDADAVAEGRSGVARWLRRQMDASVQPSQFLEALQLLADAYLREWHITIPFTGTP